MRRRRFLILGLFGVCAALLGASSSDAGGLRATRTVHSLGNDRNPCPAQHVGPSSATATPVRDRPGETLVCERPLGVHYLASSYTPHAEDFQAGCPAGQYVIDGHAGSPYAAWDYAAGDREPPSGATSWVSWGGIARWWESGGRWTGGVQPLVTNWTPVRAVDVQVWFYCRSEPAAAARADAARLGSSAPYCDAGLLHGGGSAPPAHVKLAKVVTGRKAPPPPPSEKVVVVRKGVSTLHGGRGREILEARCAGKETIDGGHGAQTLIAGRGGNDTLHAGIGTQTLIGGPGHDTLIGGKGQDTFFTLGNHNHILAGPGPSRIAAYGRRDVVDCGGHPAEVLAVRGTTIRNCSSVHYVKRPSR